VREVIVMRFFKRKSLFRKDVSTTEPEDYIDLGELGFEDITTPDTTSVVRVAEISRYEDLTDLSTHIYAGNILIIDYTNIADDELTLKRVTSELKAITRDTKGDVAGIGKNLLVVTPNGIRIDRHKIKPTGI
jgi:hypothetical protein